MKHQVEFPGNNSHMKTGKHYHDSEQAMSIRSYLLNLEMIHVIRNITVSNHIFKKPQQVALSVKTLFAVFWKETE